MHRPTTSLRAQLDDLAARVAAAIETDDLAGAWEHTRDLERRADPAAMPATAVPVPPAPVIGRRFAAAHRRLLANGDPACRAPAA